MAFCFEMQRKLKREGWMALVGGVWRGWGVVGEWGLLAVSGGCQKEKEPGRKEEKQLIKNGDCEKRRGRGDYQGLRYIPEILFEMFNFSSAPCLIT